MNISKKNKANTIFVIFLMILFFPFIQQRTYEEVPNIIRLFYRHAPIFSATIMYIYIFVRGKIFVDKYVKLSLLFWAYIIFTTIFFNNLDGLSFLLFNAYSLFGLTLFLNQVLKIDTASTLKSLSNIYHFFILLNFILFVFFPNGIYETMTYHTGHLLGDDNALIYLILPGLIINFVNSYYNTGKISRLCIFELVSTIFMFIRVWSVTSMLCIILFTVLLIANKYVKSIKTNRLIYFLVAFIVLLFFGLDTEFIQNIITNIFHKTVTLSGRTYLWKMSLDMIQARFFLGYGGYFKHGHFLMNGINYPCHTPFLQMLIDGGIVYLLIFVYIIYTIYKQAQKYSSNNITKILVIGLTVILINYIFEYSQFYHLYIILMLINNLNVLIKEESNHEQKN